MSQESPTSEGPRPARRLHPFAWRRITLTWKITTIFAVLITLVGVAIIALVLSITAPVLRSQYAQRASTVATNLADAVAGPVVETDPLKLQAVVDKYARLEGVAYIFVENGHGKLISHSLRTFPQELRRSWPLKLTPGAFPWRKRVVQGRPVYETRAPILDKETGTAHVGFWADLVEANIQQTLFLLVGLIILVLIVGLLISLSLTRLLVRPIQRLTETADKISRGHLEKSLPIDSQDEVGNLARSIERLRASLKTAMARLTTG